MKHIKIVSFIFLFVFALSCILLIPKMKADVVKSKYFNYVEKGAKVVKTSPSTQFKLMETYPQSTVTVYNVGTTDLATIWADRDGLILKANPFIADVDSFYYFYVDCGRYDIKFSGTGIAFPYTYGDVAICGSVSSGTGNVSTLGGTEDFIVKFTSSTEIGDSVLYNPLNVQAGSSTLFGWTAGAPTASLDIALGRNSTGKVEINSGTLGVLRDLTLHRIEPIPTITIPGLNFGVIATDPTAPVIGDCWYNSSLSAFRCFIGSTVTLSTGSGITSINALTAAAQFLVVGTAGTDFNIASSVATHTFNLPDASLTNRGVVTINAQSFNGDKTFDDNVLITSNIVNSFLYSDSTKAVQTTLAPTNGQLLIGSSGTAPVVANILGDSKITIVNTAGGIQVTCPSCATSAGNGCFPDSDNRIPYRINATTCGDSPFLRESANLVSQVNTTNPQTFQIYKSTADESRLRIGNVLNVWEIISEDNSGLADDIDIIVGDDPTEVRYRFTNSRLHPSLDGSIELGSGAFRWSTFFGNNINIAAGADFQWLAVTHLRADLGVDGGLRLFADDGTSSPAIVFGNNDATWLRLIRSGINLEVKNGDASAFSSVIALRHCYSGTTVCDYAGAGSPEGAITANVGSTYRRTDGGAVTSFYVKESGTGNTGWAAK